ncbi:unnamed protein product [Moneuplotes crassus]|uniref:Uncharacterized protein n=1 Tax=Euplotes crassus TaxID=5936 RepID=A0AAD1U7W9_EUPCR|nr:unnamed protein product [Moneuplotes crassus]
MSESGLKENQEFLDNIMNSQEDAKSIDHGKSFAMEPTHEYDLDKVISLDFGILKRILMQLLNEKQQRDNFKADAAFRIDILKNRVDQLVCENEDRKKECTELIEFKNSAADLLEKSKINDKVLEKSIESTNAKVAQMEQYLKTTAAATGGLNKDEFIKLLASKAEKDIDEKLSRSAFEDHRDNMLGRLRDITNESDEIQERMKVIERQMNIHIKKGKGVDTSKRRLTSHSIASPRFIEELQQKIEGLESFVDTLKNNFKSFEKEAKYDLSSLKVDKAETTLVDKNIADTMMLQEKFNRLDKLYKANQENIMKKLRIVEKTHIPHFQKKISYHDEAIGLNKACIRNLELDSGSSKKKLKFLENKEIDLSSVEMVNLRIEELTDAVKVTRTDIASVAKEIREILYTKVDDETLTELEDNILAKMNDLSENIKKNFSKKTETKIGFKNINSQIRDLYGVLLTMPRESGKGEEDDALLSKIPLGGYSCASCDKKIVNLSKVPSQDSASWNQMPFRDKGERFSKIGSGFKSILKTVRKEMSPNNLSYKDRMKKLADISESMSQLKSPKIEVTQPNQV